MELNFVVNTERIRNLGAKKGNVASMSTPEAEAFMLLFHEAIDTQLGLTLKKFVTDKMKPVVING